MRRSRLLVLTFFIALIPELAAADSSDIAPAQGGFLLPAGAQPVEFSVVYVADRASSRSRRVRRKGGSGPRETSNVIAPVSDGQLIDSQEEYARVFKSPPAKIDWKTSRLYAFEETTSYRFDRIDSRTTLGGIYRFEDVLYILITSTHLGPCQGIAQLPEWFTYKSRILFLKIPRSPERIVTAHQVVGGCPPDIP